MSQATIDALSKANEALTKANDALVKANRILLKANETARTKSSNDYKDDLAGMREQILANIKVHSPLSSSEKNVIIAGEGTTFVAEVVYYEHPRYRILVGGDKASSPDKAMAKLLQTTMLLLKTIHPTELEG